MYLRVILFIVPMVLFTRATSDNLVRNNLNYFEVMVFITVISSNIIKIIRQIIFLHEIPEYVILGLGDNLNSLKL